MATVDSGLTVTGLLEDMRLGGIITEVRIYWAVCAAILFWEYIVTLGAEHQVVWRRRQWSPLKVLYLMNRYFALVWMVIQLVSYSMDWSPGQCWNFWKYQVFGLLTIMTICESILIARVAALYDNNRYILAGFGAWMLVQTSYCAVLCGLAKPEMLVEGDGPCVMLRPFPWFFTCFCWHAAFDTIIIVMTLIKTNKLQERAPTPLVDRIHNDGQLYYIALVSTNLFNIIPMAIPGVRDRPMINIPLSAITTTIMCTRLVLRLRQTATTSAYPSLSFSGLDGPAALRRACEKGLAGSGSTGSSNSGVLGVNQRHDPTRSWRTGSTVVSGSTPLSPTAIKFQYSSYDEEESQTKSGVMIETETEVEVDRIERDPCARPQGMLARIVAQRQQEEIEMRGEADSGARRRSMGGDREKHSMA